MARKHKPRSRVHHKLPPEFASDYIRALKVLSRKHPKDDPEEVKKALRLLRNMSRQTLMAKRGELWIPSPDKRTGHFPIIEDVPYGTVRTMLRKNVGERVRNKARDVVAASAKPFQPLFARRPGTLNEAQRKRFLEQAMVALPFTKGRTPAFLGKRVPGAGPVRSRSIISSRPGEMALSPEEWERGFTLKKFSMNEDLSKAIKRRMEQKPRLQVPETNPPKPDLKEVLKNAMDTKIKLEPEQSNYAVPDMRFRPMRKRVRIGGGFADGINAEQLRRRRRQQRANYILTDVDRMCYEDGFRERLTQIGQTVKRKAKRAWRWTRGEILPTIARGAVTGGAGVVQQEWGMAPTTIGLDPVTRVGLDQKLLAFPNQTLRDLVQNLQTNLVSETDPAVRKGLERSLGLIATELVIRRRLL